MTQAAAPVDDASRRRTIEVRSPSTNARLGEYPAADRERVAAAVARHRGDPQALLRLAAALYDQRSRSPPPGRDFLTQCIERVLEEVATADPDNRTAHGLRRALHEG